MAQDGLRRGQEELKSDLLGRMTELKADLQSQLQRVEAGLQNQINGLQGQINDLKKDVGWVRNYALGIMLIAVLGLLARSFIR